MMLPLLDLEFEAGVLSVMLIENVTALRDQMNQDGISFCFTGFMTEDVLGGIALALKQNLVLENVDINTAKGVFSTVIELSQNIIRYSAEHKKISSDRDNIDLRYGVLAVGCEDQHYYVVCGNLISKEDAKRLSKNLTHIQGLDRKALKVMYKQILRGGTPEGSKGAGVGFVEIALRATNGFEFDLQDSGEDSVFFAVKASM